MKNPKKILINICNIIWLIGISCFNIWPTNHNRVVLTDDKTMSNHITKFIGEGNKIPPQLCMPPLPKHIQKLENLELFSIPADYTIKNGIISNKRESLTLKNCLILGEHYYTPFVQTMKKKLPSDSRQAQAIEMLHSNGPLSRCNLSDRRMHTNCLNVTIQEPAQQELYLEFINSCVIKYNNTYTCILYSPHLLDKSYHWAALCNLIHKKTGEHYSIDSAVSIARNACLNNTLDSYAPYLGHYLDTQNKLNFELQRMIAALGVFFRIHETESEKEFLKKNKYKGTFFNFPSIIILSEQDVKNYWLCNLSTKKALIDDLVISFCGIFDYDTILQTYPTIESALDRTKILIKEKAYKLELPIGTVAYALAYRTSHALIQSSLYTNHKIRLSHPEPNSEILLVKVLQLKEAPMFALCLPGNTKRHISEAIALILNCPDSTISTINCHKELQSYYNHTNFDSSATFAEAINNAYDSRRVEASKILNSVFIAASLFKKVDANSGRLGIEYFTLTSPSAIKIKKYKDGKRYAVLGNLAFPYIILNYPKIIARYPTQPITKEYIQIRSSLSVYDQSLNPFHCTEAAFMWRTLYKYKNNQNFIHKPNFNVCNCFHCENKFCQIASKVLNMVLLSAIGNVIVGYFELSPAVLRHIHTYT